MMKIKRVFETIDRIEDEHPSKEKKLGEDEKPHAQFGTSIVLMCLHRDLKSPLSPLY
jgi:hypothetical protein